MQNSKYSKALTIGLIVIILIIIGLLIFWVVSALSKNKLESDAREAKSQFNTVIEDKGNKNTNTNISSDSSDSDDAYNNIVFTQSDVTNKNGDSEDGEKMYKGFPMIGYIEIPKTKVEYPILKETTTAGMEVAICKMPTEATKNLQLNVAGNTILAGHNFRNGTLFSDNAKLSIGDKIYITDASGKKMTYTIYKKFQTTPEDTDFMKHPKDNADSEINKDPNKIMISLTTCTDDSQARIIIQAKAN